jgi:hypothetical protein
MWARMLLCATASAMLSLAAFAQTETVASQIVTELWTPKTAIQILAGSAVITALINTIWFAVTAGLQRLQQWWNAKSTVYPVVFSRGLTRERYVQIKSHIDGFSCMHVRFGSDQYLSSLASDQEKYEGRLRNKVLPIEMRFDASGNATFTLRLPLHKRIGTQFKCFVTVRHADAVDVVKQFLQGCDRINNLSVSKSVKSNRIYFLLDRFDQVTTVDGHANNMAYPE